MRSADPLAPGEKRKLSRLRRDLLAWAARHGRQLPWRAESASTYEKIVVEVLLQRTTAAAVAGFYPAFVGAFPGWDALARAEPADLEVFLRPLGLWRRRAASLAGLARYAAAAGGAFPRDARRRAEIPAVGQYVSNAIALFQHGERAPLLDVNMARVIERFVRPRKLADIRHDPWLQDAARWLVRRDDPAQVNWAVLDFAALVCKARAPSCDRCPLRSCCAYARAAKRGRTKTKAVGLVRPAGASHREGSADATQGADAAAKAT